MITLVHFVGLAIRNLRRGGQRVLVALLCITFGITVLVAMTMLAESIESSLLIEPAELIGGDLSMVREIEDIIRPEDVNQLELLQQSGKISRYTLIAYNSSSIMFTTSGSVEMHFVGIGLGIEPEKYPLAGSLTIGEAGSRDAPSEKAGLPGLLQQAGDVVITRDLALEYRLKVGDPIRLSDLRVGLPLDGTVRGIAYDTPNHQGDKVYYSIEIARALANEYSVVNTAIVNTAQPKQVTEELDSSGWSVDWSAGGRSKQTANLWVIGLRGAGILGLLVGGIGIANTMQVLLRRRQGEIAVWKTLGYRESDLGLIFSLEAGLLGLTGSLLGAGLGSLISGQVLELIRRISTVLYPWTFSSTPLLMGILVGTLSTVIFASWSMIVTSQARPMALLRSEPVDSGRIPGCQSVVLALFLAAPLIFLTSLVMESVAAGIGVLVCMAIGIAMLSGFFSAALWVCTRVLPLQGFPLARMAVNSLHRRGNSLIFAMIALFVGVFSMSLGLGVAQFSERKILSGPASRPGFLSYNLNILASASQESAIRQAVQGQNPEKVGVGYRIWLGRLNVVGDGRPDGAMKPVLVGRSDPEDYVISGAEWGSQPEGVYAYQKANLSAGSQVEAIFPNGKTKIFTVVGSYDINNRSISLSPPIGLLMTAEGFTRVTQPDSLTYFVQVSPDQVSRAAAALGAALPRATVVDQVAYAGRYMHSTRKLFVLPFAISGLALLGGFLLVANSVSLAMLDRRYEIGILKTVGYSRRQILSILAAEYGLVGLLSTCTGVIAIEALLMALAITSHLPASILLLSFPSLALIAFFGVGLTLLTVFGVTWEPTRVSPMIVLNEGN